MAIIMDISSILIWISLDSQINHQPGHSRLSPPDFSGSPLCRRLYPLTGSCRCDPLFEGPGIKNLGFHHLGDAGTKIDK